MGSGLRVWSGGSGEALILFLHGLGATGDVWQAWRPWLEDEWPGRWLAPDLPGHGGSPPLDACTFDGLAAAVAPLVQPGAEPIVVGHSLGGVVALALASGRFGVRLRAAVGLGIKVAWSPEELRRAQQLAERPVTWFGSRDEAAQRYLKVSGISTLLDPASPAVDAGLRQTGGRWRLAADPGAYAVGAPDLPALLAGARAPVTLARGENDPMNTDEQLAALGVPAVTLPGLGHNAHLENPPRVIALLDPYWTAGSH